MEATKRYRDSLPNSPADEHLVKRGLVSVKKQFALGYVSDPLPGHEQYRGMLAIPYIRFPHGPGKPAIIVSLRFRCLEDHEHNGHGKYNTVTGDRPRLFNTLALIEPHDRVAITEGEVDAMTSTANGLPAVGLPGSTTWQEHFREPFLGYETVFVLADGDDPGRSFARTITKDLPNAKAILMPDGYDVNKLVCQYGREALLERTV